MVTQQQTNIRAKSMAELRGLQVAQQQQVAQQNAQQQMQQALQQQQAAVAAQSSQQDAQAAAYAKLNKYIEESSQQFPGKTYFGVPRGSMTVGWEDVQKELESAGVNVAQAKKYVTTTVESSPSYQMGIAGGISGKENIQKMEQQYGVQGKDITWSTGKTGDWSKGEPVKLSGNIIFNEPTQQAPNVPSWAEPKTAGQVLKEVGITAGPKPTTTPIQSIPNFTQNKRVGETYQDYSGMFVSPPQFVPPISSSTLVLRPPTIQEKNKLNKLSENIATISTKELGKKASEGIKLQSDLDSLSTKINELTKGKIDPVSNTFIGTEKEYEDYSKVYDKYLSTQNRYNDIKNIRAGFGLLSTDVNILQKEYAYGGIPGLIKTGLTTSGGIFGGLSREVSKEYGATEEKPLFVLSSTQPTYNLPYQTRGTIQRDVLTGKEIGMFKPGEVNLGLNITPSKAEKYGSTFGEIAPYFIPVVGAPLFYTEVGSKAGESILRSGNIKKGTIQFVKDYPVEASIVGGAGLLKAGKVISKPFREVIFTEISAPVRKEIQLFTKEGEAKVSMSALEKLGISKEVIQQQRGFVGTGLKLDIGGTERRVVVSTKIRNWLGLKPIYSGKYGGEKIFSKRFNPFTGRLEVVSKKISATESKKGYQKAKDILMDNKFTKEQAKQFLRRYTPKYTVSRSLFGGDVIQTSGATNKLNVLLGGIRKEIPQRVSLGRIDLGGGKSVESFTRGGKIKKVKVLENIKEVLTKTPKGKEIGDTGEITLFKGTTNELYPLRRVGKKSETFEESIAAKKIGSLKSDLGSLEQYKTLDISKRITYKKPKKFSYSISNIEVKVPELTRKKTIDLTAGSIVEEARSIGITKEGVIVKSEDWTKVAERELPIRQNVADFITPSGKAKKTPLSKTFGEQPIVTWEVPPMPKAPRVSKEEAKRIYQTLESIYGKTEITKEVPKMNIKEASRLISGKVSTFISPKKSIKTTNLISLPRMVGGEVTTKSLFAGNGMYELYGTSSGLTKLIKQPTITTENIKPVQLSTNIQTSKEEIKLKEELKIRLENIPKFDSLVRERIKEEIKPKEELKINLKLNQKLEQKQQQRLTPRVGLKLNQKVPRETKIKLPKIKVPIFQKIESPNSRLSSLTSKKIKSLFGVEVKRKGKWFGIGKEEKLGRAMFKGTQYVKSTLGASFRITKEGKTIKPTFLPSSEFYLSKSRQNIGAVVQRRGFRLSSRPEVKEIQLAKKYKGGFKW